MKPRRLHHRAAAFRAATGAAVAAALLFGTIGNPGAANAQAGASCSATTAGAAADSNQAYVDLGVGAKATFVCISSSLFTGGKSDPISANGLAGGGCYVVEGIGTSVVAVYWQGTTATPSCPALVRIDVGTSTVATVTPTATATATTTATATATQPASTPTPRPATATPAPPTAAPTTPAATPSAVAPRPPSTGSGSSGSTDSGGLFGPLGLAVLTLAVAAGATAVITRRNNRA